MALALSTVFACADTLNAQERPTRAGEQNSTNLESEEEYYSRLWGRITECKDSIVQTLSEATLLCCDTIHAHAESMKANKHVITPLEPEQEHSTHLREWITSKEGGQAMKEKLKKAISELDHPRYATRNEATETIMTSMDALQEIVFPFPEELREIVGIGLFPCNDYDENFRYDMRMNHGFSPEQAMKLESIQDKETRCFPMPRLMPGIYSYESLLREVSRQTGMRIISEPTCIPTDITITEHQNTWTDVLMTLQKSIGDGYLHYDAATNTMRIDTQAGQDEETIVNGLHIVVAKLDDCRKKVTEVTMVPSMGSCIALDNFSGESIHTIQVTGVSDADTENLNCCCCSRDRNDGSQNVSHPVTIRALTGAPMQIQNIPFGSVVRLGKHQVVHAKKSKYESLWKVTIWLEPLEGKDAYPKQHILWEVLRRTNYAFINNAGEEIPMLPGNEEIPWDDNMSFTLDSEPESIDVQYIPYTSIQNIHMQ